MKQYFSTDSIIFAFVSIILIVLGSSTLLMIWLILSAVFILSKSKFSQKRMGEVWFKTLFGGILGGIFFGTYGILVVITGFWLYMVYQLYLA